MCMSIFTNNIYFYHTKQLYITKIAMTCTENECSDLTSCSTYTDEQGPPDTERVAVSVKQHITAQVGKKMTASSSPQVHLFPLQREEKNAYALCLQNGAAASLTFCFPRFTGICTICATLTCNGRFPKQTATDSIAISACCKGFGVQWRDLTQRYEDSSSQC